MSTLKNAFVTMLAAALLSSCATTLPPPTRYDFGSLRPLAADKPAPLPATRVADMGAPAWLDGDLMRFRLAYANEQQMRAYSASRWVMPPAQLFSQRLKSRLAEADGIVLPATDGGNASLLLRLELDDFIQTFDSKAHSWVRVATRASLYSGRTLLQQKTFVRDLPAPTPDAAGGARALAEASDAVIGDMMSWLAAQATRK